MNADQLLNYLHEQEQAIQGLAKQLDEVQVAFNAQFDQFKAQHDAALARVTDLVAGHLQATEGSATVPDSLRRAVEQRLPEEREKIGARREIVRAKYLPERRQAADAVLQEAQAEQAETRTLNPQLDAREESLKKHKAELEGRLGALNDQISTQSRGLGVVTHFVPILRADQERQRVTGKLEVVNSSLREVRTEWQAKHEAVEKHQTELQARWQMESIAVARLQAELDQLDDPAGAEELALRRAVYRALDLLVDPTAGPDPDLNAALQQVADLNRQTDDYQAGLASVAGLIGLLTGIAKGLGALRESVQGLKNEQQMHSAYLKPLRFDLPSSVDAFHKQWAVLDERFADEKEIAGHPAEFSAAVKPLIADTLSQARIEAMFTTMGAMLQEATHAWS